MITQKQIDDSYRLIADDYIELWSLIRILTDKKNMDEKTIIKELLELLTVLFTQYNVVIFDTDTYQNVDVSPEEALMIVKNYLAEINRIPELGDGLWLNNK